MSNKTQLRVIVEVQGGVCVGVYSDDPTINVSLLDWDNVDMGDQQNPDTIRDIALANEAHQLTFIGL